MNTNNVPTKTNEIASLGMMIDLIKYPVLNFKAFKLLNENKQYMFDVDMRLTKPQIKKLFENYFGVNVINVNTLIPPRQTRRYTAIVGYKNRYKRVIIKLEKDQSIPYVDSLMAGFLKQVLQRMNNQNQTQDNGQNTPKTSEN
nr:ribosomal protein L23 [Chaetopeltis orbicularis]